MSSPRNTRLGPLPKPIPAPMLAASRTRSSGKTSRDFFSPLFLKLLFSGALSEGLVPLEATWQGKSPGDVGICGLGPLPLHFITSKRCRNQLCCLAGDRN